MKKFLKFLSLLVLINVIHGMKSYKNYKLYDVFPSEKNHPALSEWEAVQGIDFFRLRAPGMKTTVLVAPEKVQEFEEFLVRAEIPSDIVFDDYEIPLEEERASIAKNRAMGHKAIINENSENRAWNFGVFWRYHEMDAYINDIASRFPQFVTRENLIVSPGGRNIYAVRISNGVFGQKPIVAMESGMHAREWACPPAVFYLIDQLVTNVTVRNELLARVDWLIIPMQNPDGYEFSWTNDRMWRQNRRQITPTCIGADLNRNFAFNWRPATLAQPCGSLVYPGPSALSEPEDFVLDRIVARYRSNVRLYLSVHSFGDLILFPWSYREAQHPHPNAPYLYEVGYIWSDAIRAVTGKDYLVANSYDFFGNIHGSVDDNMMGLHEAHLSYTLEFTNGFDFRYPEERIFALAQESFIGFRALALHIGQQYG